MFAPQTLNVKGYRKYRKRTLKRAQHFYSRFQKKSWKNHDISKKICCKKSTALLHCHRTSTDTSECPGTMGYPWRWYIKTKRNEIPIDSSWSKRGYSVFLWIFFVFHWFWLDFHWFPLVFIDFHWFPLIFIGFWMMPWPRRLLARLPGAPQRRLMSKDGPLHNSSAAWNS